MFTETLWDSFYCHLTDEESEDIKEHAEGQADSDGWGWILNPGSSISEPPY